MLCHSELVSESFKIMSEISGILQKLEGTREAEILVQMEAAYKRIYDEQKAWYENSKFVCPEGCGCCCHNFEPDLLEAEALFMAAWLLENQSDVAAAVAQGKFPFENGKTCPFHNFENPYHCSIYNGRPSICRLFGASGAHGKNGAIVWKPCKFIPVENLQKHKPPLEHKQYSAEETKEIFGVLPPVMADLMEPIASINPENNETKLIREILPKTINRLMWICSMNE